MRTAETYRGYEVVETDWTTEVRVGFDRAEVRPVYVIPGMKERPSSPFLTTVQEARDYIDKELAGREAMREARTATFEASVKVRGAASLGVTIPAPAARALGLDVGDRVRVTVERMARRGAGRRVPARSCASSHGVPGRTGDAPGRTRRREDGAVRLIEWSRRAWESSRGRPARCGWGRRIMQIRPASAPQGQDVGSIGAEDKRASCVFMCMRSA